MINNLGSLDASPSSTLSLGLLPRHSSIWLNQAFLNGWEESTVAIYLQQMGISQWSSVGENIESETLAPV